MRTDYRKRALFNVVLDYQRPSPMLKRARVKPRFYFFAGPTKPNPEGIRTKAIGFRSGHWPCLGPFIQLEFWIWRVGVWYGNPSYRKFP